MFLNVPSNSGINLEIGSGPQNSWKLRRNILSRGCWYKTKKILENPAVPWELQWLYPAHPATSGPFSHFSTCTKYGKISEGIILIIEVSRARKIPLTGSSCSITNQLSPLWNVPEAHVGALRLWHNKIELVRHAVDPVHLVIIFILILILLLSLCLLPGSRWAPSACPAASQSRCCLGPSTAATAWRCHCDARTGSPWQGSSWGQDVIILIMLPCLPCRSCSRNTCLSGKGNLPTSDCSRSRDSGNWKFVVIGGIYVPLWRDI